ncbi:hypothetical protein OAO55_03140 [Bacteroidales bacterium]|nr:hypothetical protein [Bacteroidales bacterium]
MRTFNLILITFLFLQCNPGNQKKKNTSQQKRTIVIENNIQCPETEFGEKDLQLALTSSRYTISDDAEDITLKIEQSETLSKQAYSIKQVKKGLLLLQAGDKLGAMYGLLDIAEQVRLNVDLLEISEKEESPYIEHRGIKMNIALDGRLPSYDDTGDAAQKNIAEMWNINFWVEYLDDLARHRYNLLSLWSKHPFPALCKMADYPGAAMEDVYIYDKPITWDIHRDWKGIDIQNKANLRKIKSMTMDEKIAFWQKVMEHANNRGIDIIWFTWNIFISPGTGEITDHTSDEAIIYMRKAVQEMVETYPHLSGFGVTAGERMGMTVGEYSAPGWMFETYGKGVIAAKENNPDRPFRFIFRRHHAFLETIQNDFASKFPGEVETSYKYNVSRMYSSPRPPIFEREYLADVKKYDFKCWMNVRNDDMFTFRWGDPDFVREYLTGMMSYGVVPGFYMGSDGYLWGREFTSKNPNLSGELEIKKHWYRYMLWGRLAYNPNIKDAYLQDILGMHFPKIDKQSLFHAWAYASKVIPAVCNFHWKPADAMWSTEGCMDQYNGFQTVRDFIDCYTLENDKLQNITDYVIALQYHEEHNLITPFQLADSLRFCAQQVYENLEKLKEKNTTTSDKLKATLTDLECFALYGEYYAGKIAGATYLHMYENLNNSQKDSYKIKAIEQTEKAAKAWRKLAALADSQYKVQLLARTRELDWKKTTEDVEHDIEIVKASSGKEPKVAKLFYSGHAKIKKEQRKKLSQFLNSKGYKVEEYAGWKTEAYASGLKIAFAIKGGLVSQFYTSRGGKYPSNFEDTGIIINNIHHKTWVIGKDIEHANLAIDKVILELEKNLN